MSDPQRSHLLLLVKSLTQNRKEKVTITSPRTTSSPSKIITPTRRSTSINLSRTTTSTFTNYGLARLQRGSSSRSVCLRRWAKMEKQCLWRGERLLLLWSIVNKANDFNFMVPLTRNVYWCSNFEWIQSRGEMRGCKVGSIRRRVAVWIDTYRSIKIKV